MLCSIYFFDTSCFLNLKPYRTLDFISETKRGSTRCHDRLSRIQQFLFASGNSLIPDDKIIPAYITGHTKIAVSVHYIKSLAISYRELAQSTRGYRGEKKKIVSCNLTDVSTLVAVVIYKVNIQLRIDEHSQSTYTSV